MGTGLFEDQYVRPANPTDKPFVLRLLESENLALDFVAKEFVVCETGGRIIACARARPLAEGGTEVLSVVVDRAHRGRGLGRDLLTMALLGARHPVFAFAPTFGLFVRSGFEPVPEPESPPGLTRREPATPAREPGWRLMRLRRIAIPDLAPEDSGTPDFLEG